MTQRSVLAGKNETIIIKAGGSVSVKGQEGDRLVAESTGGLSVDRRSDAEIGRARAAVGEHVLFDLRLKMPGSRGSAEILEVQIGGSGEVRVPFETNLKVYAGKDIHVHGIRGQVDAYAGLDLHIQDVGQVGNVSAGRTMDIDCQTMSGKDVTFSAGGDLRFHVADLTSVRLRVKDLGGYWEARIGEGERLVYLKAGGEVTLVTDQQVEALPPNYVLGKIERPSA
jgi:hypothetical protein